MRLVKEFLKLIFTRRTSDENFSKQQLKDLEEQLSHPKGMKGMELGHTMHTSNYGMIMESIVALKIDNSDTILELGHGNCHHLSEIIKSANDVSFHGLEVSEVMHEEAIQFKGNINANFQLYDGVQIPYQNDFFDKIMTVNTIYFWSKPTTLISEIDRVLKIGGICVLTLVSKEFMKNLPFVGDKFTLYGILEIESLIEKTKLEIINSQRVVESVENKVGKVVDREYHIIKLKKI